MILTYLSGVGRLARLTKTFIKEEDGTITKTAYPNANRMNSFTDDVNTIESFMESIRRRAARGHALFTGQLTKQLVGESRRGMAVRGNKMQWMCLDFDNADIEDLDKLIQSVPGLCDVSYVVAHSASARFKAGANAHVFFLLDDAIPHDQLVTLVSAFNWHIPELRKQLRLSDTKRTIAKPLDTAGVRPSGLIYLAPPELVGLIDPFSSIEERIYLVKKDRDQVSLSRFPSIWLDSAMVSLQLRGHLNTLRDEAGLPPVNEVRRRAEVDGVMVEYDAEPGNLYVSIVPGPLSTNGMVRCNVNGGDSGAYYFNYGPIGDGKNGTLMTLLGNFKGDPPILLATAAPEFTAAWNASFAKVSTMDVPEWLNAFQEAVGNDGQLLSPIVDAEDVYKDMDRVAKAESILEDEDEEVSYMDPRGKIIFRDGYTGEHFEYAYLSATGTPFFSSLKKGDAVTRAKAIGLKYDKERGFPTLWMVHEPRRKELLFEVDGVPMINAFVHPKTLNYDAERDIEIDNAMEHLRTGAPTVATCLYHAFGNDLSAANQFLNWLSVHLTMLNERVNTAWLLRGTQGSGKSLIVSDILPAVLGYGHSTNNADASLGYCATIKLATALDKFSGWQMGKRVVEVEEAEFTGVDRASRNQGMQELKRLVTRERADINVKYGGQLTNVRVYTGFIFTTNRQDEFPIEDFDRRFHVPRFQYKPLWEVLPEVQSDFNAVRSKFKDEAVAVGDLLSRLKASPKLAQTPFDCGDKNEIVSANRSNLANFAHYVSTGDYDAIAEIITSELSEVMAFAGRYEDAAQMTAAKTLAYIAMTAGGDSHTPASMLMALAQTAFPTLGRLSPNRLGTELKAVEVGQRKMRLDKGMADMFPELASGTTVSHYRVTWKSDNFDKWSEHPLLADIIKQQKGFTSVAELISG